MAEARNDDSVLNNRTPITAAGRHRPALSTKNFETYLRVHIFWRSHHRQAGDQCGTAGKMSKLWREGLLTDLARRFWASSSVSVVLQSLGPSLIALVRPWHLHSTIAC